MGDPPHQQQASPEEESFMESDETFEQEEEEEEDIEEEEEAVADLWTQKATVDNEIESEIVDSQDEGPLFYSRKQIGSRGRRGGARSLKSRE